MAFPINFVAGAAIGAVAAYVVKDEMARNWVVDTSKKLKDQTGNFIDSMKKKPAEGEATPAETVASETAATETVTTEKPAEPEAKAEQVADSVEKAEKPAAS